MSKIVVFFEHLHRVINLVLYRHIPDTHPNSFLFLLTTRLNRAEPIYTETRSCFGDMNLICWNILQTVITWFIFIHSFMNMLLFIYDVNCDNVILQWQLSFYWSISQPLNDVFSLQVIAHGFVLGHSTYLRSGWNVMDGLLVLVSLIDLILSLTAAHSRKIFGILRVFRLLRTLRPLR